MEAPPGAALEVVQAQLLLHLLITLLHRPAALPQADGPQPRRTPGSPSATGALLFTIGKTLIGLYLAYTSTTSVYGAAGSLVVFLVWVYYSAQIFLLGAEYAR